MKAAVILYAVGLFLPAFSWFMLWLYANAAELVDTRLTPQFIRFLNRQYLLSNLVYGASLAIAFFSPMMSLAMSIGLTILYLLPPKRPEFVAEAGTTASDSGEHE